MFLIVVFDCTKLSKGNTVQYVQLQKQLGIESTQLILFSVYLALFK